MATNKKKEILSNKKISDITAARDSGNTAENDNNSSLLKKESSVQIYKSLIDNSIFAIFLGKINGQIIEVNSAAEKMFGYTKEEFLKLGRQGIIDHTDPNLHTLLVQRKETGKTNGEITGIKKNKEPFAVEFTSSIFEDHSGEELTCTTMQDITNRKNIEQQMLLMLNNTDESFILLDKELIVLNFNKQFNYLSKKLFNVVVEKGKHILDYAQPKRVNIAKDNFKKVLNGEVVYDELPVISLHGIENYFAVKYTPSKDTQGDLVGILLHSGILQMKKNRRVKLQSSKLY